jgi:hypothetical protein
MYYIYDQSTTRILSRESKSYQQAAYKTMSAAQAALTRMQKKYVQRNGVAAQAEGPLYTAAIAEAEYYSKNIERFVTRKNMMSGKEYTESVNTPNYMSPASEAYWSM